MAKTKVKISEPAKTNMLTRPELWLGVSTLFVVGLVALRSNFWQQGKAAVAPINDQKVMEQKTKKSEEKSEQSSQPELSAVIKRLADTSGTISYIVNSGDTFWKISEDICGKGDFAEQIKAENGYGPYRSLQKGDVVNVKCE